MEVINLAGYTNKEKKHILEKYLLPEALMNAGLAPHGDKFEITNPVQDYIINNYSREPGVRSLKKFVNKIAEKITFELVERED